MDLQAWRDQQRASIRDSIRRRGWSIQYVGGGECSRPGCTNHDDDLFPFGYTIGLYGMDHPELLILGADTHTTAHVLDALGQRIKEGEMLMPGMLLTIDGWPHRIVPEPVPNPGEILLSALDYYRRPAEYPVPALQLTYDDAAGRFPWEDGFAAPDLQPRPGTFTA